MGLDFRQVNRRVRAGSSVALGLGLVALTGAFTTANAASSPHFIRLADSVPATTDHVTGGFSANAMSVEVALAPRDGAALAARLKAMYTMGTSGYHRWLSRGQFDARYAPSGAERTAVASYLRGAGLTLRSSSDPFLVAATGSSRAIEAAFRTTLRSYSGQHGARYFSNSAPVSVPSSIAGGVLGVIGLTNTVRNHAGAHRVPGARSAVGRSGNCETGYPTTKELFAFYDNKTQFPFGYGAGPGCSGLSPAQTNSVYGAPRGDRHAKGAGETAAVFELSAYQASDIATWAHQFYGTGYAPKLTEVTVDGGPLNPVCPTGDTCPAQSNGYAGDIEVDADIETELAVAPDASKIAVYNAPNDFTGQTELDEYSRIAADDTAATVSSSWGVCENDITSGYAQAENTVFEKMAMQGQSVFNDAGDTGAFGCIRSDGTTIADEGDPAAQPWVTGVGGTSLSSYNPGTRSHASYPGDGTETVWNVRNLCSNKAPSAANDNKGGFFFCGATGAGGGGSSQFWGRPSYQSGRGVNNSFTSTACVLASSGQPCQEGPVVSADADEYTPYAEYCTGSAATANSVCATFSGSQPVPGWFGIGGTSLSTPLWAGLITDRDSFHHARTGNINPLVFRWFNTHPQRYFHDINGAGPRQRAANNNGLFPVTPGFDEATGVGTPKFEAIITG